MALAKEVVNQTGAIREFEKPEVCEAIKVANANRWTVALSPTEWDEREARLKKEHEKDTKASGSDGDQPKEKIRIICCSASPKADFYYKHVLKEGNPALAESASKFNDALLDEQAKKIEELTKDKELMKKATLSQLDDFIEIYNLLTKESQKAKRLGKEITLLNKAIHKKNMKIEELRKESSRHLRGKIKVFYENVDLEQMLKDKEAVLSDVAEELRLSKIREKNLTEVSQKYMKENEELKKKLADKVVDKIDAQALKSAESALAYKEKVIAEKDDVIADLGNELTATKKELEEKTNLVEMVRKGSKEYREYGIAALSMIRKMAKIIVNGGPVSSKDFKEYRRLANGYSFNPQLPDFSEEEEKKLSPVKNDNSHGEVTNQKDCSPAKDTHPTEDNPDEVELDEILECVRKALEEGHTVSIKYDEADEVGCGDHYVTWESNI